MKIIDSANEIIAEYMSAGYVLTLRQLYYQFVSRDLLPNSQKSYDRLGAIIGDARLAGLIDWNAIEDRGRNLHSLPTWEKPQDIINACARQFRLDLWADQDFRPEVWVEKQALAGVIESIADKLRVPSFACKGYTSLSEMWDAGANRLAGYVAADQIPVIIHLGDHDPSGIDMTRDIRDRISMFAGGAVEVMRIALNMDQVKKYNPPPNPAKSSDSRFGDYKAKFGDQSWELDALNPKTLDQLITKAINDHRDKKRWTAAAEREQICRDQLTQIEEQYDQIVEQL